ncbi:ATP-binding cassette transporter, putative [Entamoeba dispar SAW760]|uniref:ATP-binding cassette transporter, putative n=1 Tax=Entamoeba dispar (strain ATCC PRA-260 / SAW760) TaxID=370354 RepID=B0ED97_ENTDS|nr:ATP-binding cassette transporter, putative [Entamoeba dispar SAW760]EDR27514.1 ATP-binding cassette transporter, putative [Entamoeba dispar SAW760]|eukprot:EDR27514.1 ATP-binding cassette transporter, putative [Entamoeba dispar SAW760]
MIQTQYTSYTNTIKQFVFDIQYPNSNLLSEIVQPNRRIQDICLIGIKKSDWKEIENDICNSEYTTHKIEMVEDVSQDNVLEVVYYYKRPQRYYSFCDIMNHRSKKKYRDETKALLSLFQINIHYKYQTLSITQKYIVHICCILIGYPKVIILNYLKYPCHEVISGLKYISHFVPTILVFPEINHDYFFCDYTISEQETIEYNSQLYQLKDDIIQIIESVYPITSYHYFEEFYLCVVEWGYQFVEVTKRKYRTGWRYPINIILHLFLFTIGGISIGTVFLLVNYNQTTLIQKVNVLYFATISKTLFTIDQVIYSVNNMIQIRKENQVHKVHASAYILADYIFNLPTMVLNPTLFDIVFYPFVDFQPSIWRFLKYWFTSLLSSQINVTMSALIGYIIINKKIGTFLEIAIIYTLMLFSGTIKNYLNLPKWLKWIYTISYYRITHNICFSIFFDGVDLLCDEEDIRLNNCIYQNGDVFLKKLRIDTDILRQMLFLFIWIICLRVGAIVLIRLHLFLDFYSFNIPSFGYFYSTRLHYFLHSLMNKLTH